LDRIVINPLSVLIATPSIDGKVETGYTDGLAACASEHLFATIARKDHCSDVRLARNHLAHGFLHSSFAWLVFIDADIVFTVKDFKLLMGYPIIKGQPADIIDDEATLEPIDGDSVAMWGKPLSPRWIKQTGLR
jgi:hypothetical protein